MERNGEYGNVGGILKCATSASFDRIDGGDKPSKAPQQAPEKWFARTLRMRTQHPVLCSQCIGEFFLRSKVEKNGDDAVCAYCGRTGKTLSIGDIADAIESAFREHLYQTPTEPSGMEYAMIKEGLSDWERKGEPVADVISTYAEIDPKPAEDIRKMLAERHFDMELAKMGEEGEFSRDSYYAELEVDDTDLTASWFHFEESLKTQARYFSRSGSATLASIFKGIYGLKTHDGQTVVVEAGPGKRLTALYRARVFQSDEKLKVTLERPDQGIGPPPHLAAPNGRMNAHGIAVFYGSTDPLIALAEVRPPVGSRVAVGRFEIIRQLYLLDIEALRSVNVAGSIFDSDYIHHLRRAKFLKRLSDRVTRPVMPDDEPFDYLATQAIADFLATEATPPLDGIIYSSAQAQDGKENKFNVVLFHKAARVEALQIPRGTKISAQLYQDTDDGRDIDYWVWEELPEETSSEESEASDLLVAELLDNSWQEDYDERPPTLKLDPSSLEVHHVRSVAFSSDTYPVRRHRSVKRDYKF
jgi:hypothetical protein